jgi:hypothetical protein
MAVTKRASAWLATLSRGTPIPTRAVEQFIIDAGGTPHRVWLDFHEHYAGYVEEVGPGDLACWGLARAADAVPSPVWFKPDTVYLVPAQPHFPEAIQCADAHPTHGYELGADGRYRGIGGPADSFEMKLERHGLMKEFYDRGRVRQTLLTRKSDEPAHQQLLADMAGSFVPEASSANAKFFLEPRRLLQFNPFIKQLVLLELDPPAVPST